MALHPNELPNRRRGSDVAKPAAGIGLILLLLGGGGYAVRNWWTGHQIRSQTVRIVELIMRDDFSKADIALAEAAREGKIPADALAALRTQYVTASDAYKRSTRRDCLYDPTYPADGTTAEATPTTKQPVQLTRPEPYKASPAGTPLQEDLILYEFSRVKTSGSSAQKAAPAVLRVKDRGRQTIYKTDDRECSLAEITVFTERHTVRFGPEDKDVLVAGQQRYREIAREIYAFQNRAAIDTQAEKERQKRLIATELFGVGKQ